MEGIIKSYCDLAINAAKLALLRIKFSSVEEILKAVNYGKSDTLGMDSIPEIAIINTLRNYDKSIIIITEESGGQENKKFSYFENSNNFPTVFIIDPTDRSSQIKELLQKVQDKKISVSEIFREPNFLPEWEKKFGDPAKISGGCSAITCVYKGTPVFSIIVNYITGHFFLACSAGCYFLDDSDEFLASKDNTNFILTRGKKIYFNSVKEMKLFVTFMGKSGYRENFLDSGLMTEDDMKNNLFYELAGGPLRVLYLSSLAKRPIGFILANGEKITEWIHWIPYVIWGRKENDQGAPILKLNEIYQNRPWVKNGVLMATSPPYSIFQPTKDGKMIIDVNKFFHFQNPSHIRSTLILSLGDNQWANGVVTQYGYRKISFPSDYSV